MKHCRVVVAGPCGGKKASKAPNSAASRPSHGYTFVAMLRACGCPWACPSASPAVPEGKAIMQLPEVRELERIHCAAVKADGQPCQGDPVHGSAFCWAHAPELQEKRDEARRNGGRRRTIEWQGRMDKDIATLDDVVAYLNTIRENLNAQDNTVANARAQTQLAQAFVLVMEQRDMGQRLDEIEAQLKASSA